MPNRKEFFKVMPPVGLPGFGLELLQKYMIRWVRLGTGQVFFEPSAQFPPREDDFVLWVVAFYLFIDFFKCV